MLRSTFCELGVNNQRENRHQRGDELKQQLKEPTSAQEDRRAADSPGRTPGEHAGAAAQEEAGRILAVAKTKLQRKPSRAASKTPGKTN